MSVGGRVSEGVGQARLGFGGGCGEPLKLGLVACSPVFKAESWQSPGPRLSEEGRDHMAGARGQPGTCHLQARPLTEFAATVWARELVSAS